MRKDNPTDGTTDFWHKQADCNECCAFVDGACFGGCYVDESRLDKEKKLFTKRQRPVVFGATDKQSWSCLSQCRRKKVPKTKELYAKH